MDAGNYPLSNLHFHLIASHPATLVLSAKVYPPRPSSKISPRPAKESAAKEFRVAVQRSEFTTN